MRDYKDRHEVLMNYSQTGIAPNHVTSADAMLADIILRLQRIEALLKGAAPDAAEKL
jgi:hypothetical protein